MSEKGVPRIHDGFEIAQVPIIYGKFFTKERLKEWKQLIGKCCKKICNGLMALLDPSSKIRYYVSVSLIDEVVGDAVIGMSKIIDKTPHPVEEPNAFKIAAYLSYWFLRHQPISILYPKNSRIENLKVADETEVNKKYLIWQLKHINEMVAVDLATSSIFDFTKLICDITQCRQVSRANTIKNSTNGTPEKVSYFDFNDFEELHGIIIKKLTYYFAYRAIAPKVIEHILEGYAFHPAWQLTGPHWNVKSDVQNK